MYRAWELGSQLKQWHVDCSWLLLSATLRPEEEQPLAEALAVPRINTILRGSARTDNLSVDVVQTASIQAAIDAVRQINAQIVFVKTYAEARMVATELGAGCMTWTSKAPEDDQHKALQHLANGGMLVATYGLSVGLNLKVKGENISRIILFGVPWSLSAFVQAASRIRQGGTATVIAWDLKEEAQSGVPEKKEIAAYLLAGFIEEIFSTFGPNAIDTIPVPHTPKPLRAYQECRNDALYVQGLQIDGSLEDCVLCGERSHSAARCHIMNGRCFTCGYTGHACKSCPNEDRIPACEHGFCSRCRLPTFEVAGVQVHSGSFGRDCTNTALADNVKMLLLCGMAR